jgi:Xaa-Pro aminopeptidase
LHKALLESFPFLEGYVISNPADIYYLTGYYSQDALLLYSFCPVLVTDSRYTVAAREAGVNVRITNNYIGGIIEEANRQGIKSLGIEEEHLSASDYITLTENGFSLTKTKNIFTALRCHKTDDEAERIIRAQKITDEAFNKVLPFIKEGVTEKEVRARLEYIMFSLGADGLAFDTIVASGINGAKPHAVPSDKVIRNGEFVTLDFGARLGNYNSDMTRTVAVGDITDEMKKVYMTVLHAHEAARDALRPGVNGSAVDKIARDIISSSGYGECFTHSLGHGVGIEIHEAPRLSPKSTDILQVGDVVTVEPGIYIEDLMGVRIENMYVITRDGYKNLTVSDKKLINL